MTEDDYKSRGWRNTTKRDRTPTWQWVRNKINKAHTGEEWTALFRSLTPEKQIDALIRVNPAPKEVKAESNHVVKLLIEGVNARPAIQAKVELPALDPHTPEDETE